MSVQVYVDVNLTVETCWGCGTVFGMTKAFANKRRESGKTFWCPNGCALIYGKSEVDILQEKLAQEKHAREQETARLRDRLLSEENAHTATSASLRSTKGVVTRIKNRVANGVCPCCQRTFSDLGRHMKGQHPDWNPTG